MELRYKVARRLQQMDIEKGRQFMEIDRTKYYKDADTLILLIYNHNRKLNNKKNNKK